MGNSLNKRGNYRVLTKTHYIEINARVFSVGSTSFVKDKFIHSISTTVVPLLTPKSTNVLTLYVFRTDPLYRDRAYTLDSRWQMFDRGVPRSR